MDGCADLREWTGIKQESEDLMIDQETVTRIIVDYRAFEVNPNDLAEVVQMVAVINDISDEEALSILTMIINGYMLRRTEDGKRKILEEIEAHADATLEKLKDKEK